MTTMVIIRIMTAAMMGGMVGDYADRNEISGVRTVITILLLVVALDIIFNLAERFYGSN